MVMIILSIINKLLWGIATLMLVISGIYFSKKLNFLQFSLKKMIKGFKSNKYEKVSPFKTLMLTLAGRIGVGSLAGIALAIYIGGPGTIFWIWISTIIVVPNAYVESYLGVFFHEKKDGMYEGGPSHYIEKGLKKRRLARVYSWLVLVTYIFGFLSIQSNTIAKSFQNFNNSNPFIVGIIIALITAIIIFKGSETIINISSKMMPFIGGLYIVISVYILLNNFNSTINVMNLIISEAFNIKSFGIGIIMPFIIGFQRGIFSNESGVGTGAIAASSVDNNDAKGQGMIQIAGIYFTSLVLCTLTAFIILLSDYNNINYTNVNGIELTQYALKYHLGYFGEIILLITVFIFAFSTIISGYYYGESSLSYLNNNKRLKTVLKILTIILLVLGSVIKSNILWDFVDIGVAIMAIINVYSIIKLRNIVK